MLDISFDTLIETNKKPAKSAPKSKRKVGAMLKLGDPARIEGLPDDVNEDFLNEYRDGLDRYLHSYVVQNSMTLTEAARYKEYIFDTIFGNTMHLGLFQFIRAKAPTMYSSDREMVSAAEDFLMRGWHINNEMGRYFIVNDSLDRVLDVTGSSDISEQSTGMSFTPDTAHLFLADNVASKVSALAKKAGFDADVLAGMGQLDLLLAETDNREFAGYLMNYNAMRVLLRKTGKYTLLRGTTSYTSLYEEGFRLGNQIFYPSLSRVILENGSKSVLLTSIKDDLHPEHNVNRSLLAVIAAKIRQSLYRKRVYTQGIQEIEELGYAVGLMSEFWETEATQDTITEIYGMLRRLDSGHATGSISAQYYESLRSAFSEILIGEVLLLGNTRFSLASFGFDSVGGKFFVYAGDNVFNAATTRGGMLEELHGGNEQFFTKCLRSGFTPEFVRKNLKTLLGYVSEDFRKAVHHAAIDTDSYPLDMESVTAHLDNVRSMIRMVD